MKFQFVPALSNKTFVVEILIAVFTCHDPVSLGPCIFKNFLDFVWGSGGGGGNFRCFLFCFCQTDLTRCSCCVFQIERLVCQL